MSGKQRARNVLSAQVNAAVSLLVVLSLTLPATSRADAPPFDRPGIAFSPGVLPVGSFDWEQGLPDLQYDDNGGMRSKFYTADTTLRMGLTSTLELQVAGSLWNRLDSRWHGGSSRVEGAGDTRIGLKWARPLPASKMSVGILATVTLDTGSAAFTNGAPIYSLGAVLGRDLGAGRSLAGYVNLDHSGASNTWTVSSNVGFPVHGNLGFYLEIGRICGAGDASAVGGGGLTWLLHDRVQLDLSARRGLTSRSPDLQAGLGVSTFWK